MIQEITEHNTELLETNFSGVSQLYLEYNKRLSSFLHPGQNVCLWRENLTLDKGMPLLVGNYNTLVSQDSNHWIS